MEFKYLKTKRLKLRFVDQAVMDFVFQIFNDDELAAFFGYLTAEELEEAKKKYKGGLSTYDRKFINFLLIDPSGRAMGGCGFHTWYLTHNRAEIGYGLYREDDKRKGYMSEAIEAVVEYGFKEMNLHRIEALVGPDNIGSQKLVKRLGFQYEGHMREHFFSNGNMDDSLMFGLLQRDYLGIR